jgi:hypothetical protein
MTGFGMSSSHHHPHSVIEKGPHQQGFEPVLAPGLRGQGDIEGIQSMTSLYRLTAHYLLYVCSTSSSILFYDTCFVL